MPFKIVQTHEKGLNKLSIIPSGWESKGILYWPPRNLKTTKLISDERSVPGPSWQMMPCILKRKNLATYQDADMELTIMEECTDTDHPEHDKAVDSHVASAASALLTAQPIKFEAFAEDLCQFQTRDDADPGIADTEICNTENIPVSNNILNIEMVLANQTQIMQKIDFLLENQKNIALKVASLSVQIQESQNVPINVTLLKDVQPEENESFSLTPINSVQELNEFEKSLTDKVYKKKITKLLSILCTPAEGQGITCAYKLLDTLIRREFLCQISWSGGSKGENVKVPLKSIKNFQKFFCGIVHTWDSSFSVQDYEIFFKIVLRNAVKRKSMKNLRASSKRTRKQQPKINTPESAGSPASAVSTAPSALSVPSASVTPAAGFDGN